MLPHPIIALYNQTITTGSTFALPKMNVSGLTTIRVELTGISFVGGTTPTAHLYVSDAMYTGELTGYTEVNNVAAGQCAVITIGPGITSGTYQGFSLSQNVNGRSAYIVPQVSLNGTPTSATYTLTVLGLP